MYVWRGNPWCELAICLLAAGLLSLALGQDRNWDLLNYHLYNAFSLIEGRLRLDLNAVGTQTYFNPLLDVPYYLLATGWLAHAPRAVTFLAGIPAGLLAFILWQLSRAVARCLPGDAGRGASFATFTGLGGTMLWSEIGTTYGDIPIAILVLAGLLWPAQLLSRDAPPSPVAWSCAAIVAGLLFGAAAGLKPTALIFGPAACIALVAQPGSLHRRAVAAVAFCAAWLAAFAALFGWWGLRVYQLFENPFFPHLNNIFASPWASLASAADGRFFPRGILQAVFYPFYWLQARPFIVSETDIRDPHFALAYLSLGLLCGALLSRRRTQLAHPAIVFIGVFFVLAFILWEAAFSILRYAIPLEALTGIVIYIGLRGIAVWLPRHLATERRTQAAMLLLAIAALAFANRPGWGRVRHTGDTVFAIHAPPIPEGAVVIAADKPVGFVLPFIAGKGVSFIGIVDVARGTRLADAVHARLQTTAPLRVLIVRAPETYSNQLAEFGIQLDPTTCAPVINNLQTAVTLCAAQLLH